MTSELVLIFLFSFIAFSISAVCGGGAGLMLIPALGQLLPVSQIPAALSIGTFSSSASRLILFRKNISWQIVKYFVPAALPAVWLGAWLLKFLNPVYVEIGMGLFLISNMGFLFKKPNEINKAESTTPFMMILIGFSAGFLSGLTGAVGLLFNRFYLRYGLNKEEIVATRAANEIILHLLKFVLYVSFGLISSTVVWIGTLVALAAVLSAWSIKWILPVLSELLFKKIGYFAMVSSGFLLLWQSGSDLLRANNGTINSGIINKGWESKLKWQNSNYALEFTYDEGFEFEQVIPLSELSAKQQNIIISKHKEADEILVEAVHKFGSKTYEAYYFKNKRLIEKIDIEE